METTITTVKLGEACRLIGIKRSTLCGWIRDGLILETVVKGDNERCRRIDVVALLAACLVRQLRTRGWGWQAVVPVAHFLRDTTQTELECAFAEGRTELEFVTGIAAPRLLRPGELLAGNATGRTQAIIQVPLEKNWRQLLRVLPKHVTQKATIIELLEEEGCAS